MLSKSDDASSIDLRDVQIVTASVIDSAMPIEIAKSIA